MGRIRLCIFGIFPEPEIEAVQMNFNILIYNRRSTTIAMAKW
ncbi:MAG TPA: hypothetical protein VHO50_10280 [Bacteroidales bacterium]|nr:hypothetical protein [Bacteroidales bacterium]